MTKSKKKKRKEKKRKLKEKEKLNAKPLNQRKSFILCKSRNISSNSNFESLTITNSDSSSDVMVWLECSDEALLGEDRSLGDFSQ